MPTNDFVPFATGGGANVLSQVAYLANSALPAGQQPGVASSALNNKALRQANFVASALAQLMANITGNDVLDNGVQSDLINTLIQGLSTYSGYATKSANYTLTLVDAAVVFTATANATLPTASGISGKRLTVINSSSTALVTMLTTSAQTIGGMASGALILGPGDNLTVMSNGTNWLIVSMSLNVGAKYFNEAGTTIGSSSGTVIPYETKIWDTHSCYNTGTGIWTNKVPGKYAFSASLVNPGVAVGASNQWQLQAAKNTSTVYAASLNTGTSNADTSQSIQVAGEVDLDVGDTFSLQSWLQSSSINISSSAGYNQFSMRRTAN